MHELSFRLAGNNKWNEPVFQVGRGDERIFAFFKKHHINLIPDEWDVSCNIVDRVIRIVAHEMRKTASERYPGLSIGKTLIKQGSSREGLKVCDPLEFDVLLPFEFEKIQTKEHVVFDKKGEIIPGFFKIQIVDDKDIPFWMKNNKIIFYNNGHAYVDTCNFQNKVFASLLDQTQNRINNELKTLTKDIFERFKMIKRVVSPSLKITIIINSEHGLSDLRNYLPDLEKIMIVKTVQTAGGRVKEKVEIDLVPALLISGDEFPLSVSKDQHQSFIHCERYGVMKWANEINDKVSFEEKDGNFVWCRSTCGYEKYIFDIAQGNVSQQYIMTACRLLKGMLRVYAAKHQSLTNVVNSYHLKNICFYCILFLTIPSEENRLSNVKRAMGYFVKFLQLSLWAENLPHFFFGNPYLGRMFPWDPFKGEENTYNMFTSSSPEMLKQAKLSFLHLRIQVVKLFDEERMLDTKKIKLFADLVKSKTKRNTERTSISRTRTHYTNSNGYKRPLGDIVHPRSFLSNKGACHK